MKELDTAEIDVVLIEPGAYATGFNQENIKKQFTWMYKKSYFKNKIDYLKDNQFKFLRLEKLNPQILSCKNI